MTITLAQLIDLDSATEGHCLSKIKFIDWKIGGDATKL